MKISGKELAHEVYEDILKKLVLLKEKNIIPRLIIVKSSNIEAVNHYIDQNIKKGKKLGIQVEVFDLNEDDCVNKNKIKEKIIQMNKSFRNHGIIAEYDGSGTIGRRYARADEIGVPFAVTVDHETLETNTVTIRNRDDLKQIRKPIKDIYNILIDLLEGKIEFEDI